VHLPHLAPARPSPPGLLSPGLLLPVCAGLAVGALYAAANTAFDAWDRQSPLVATLAAIHGFIDRGVPLLAGLLLGLTVHYGRLSAALARREAERADELSHRLQHIERDQAVWVVATSTLHEVRNPLHNLGLLLDEVQDLESAGPASAGERRELLGRAMVQMDRIDASIDALRRLAPSARPSAGLLDVSALVEAVARETRALGGAVRLSVATSPGLIAHGDGGFVRVILENLLRNALDAARPGGGQVHLEARAADGQIVVQVSDDGPGIDEEHRRTLFEPLATTKQDGMGLGLAVSRALARAMQAEVCWQEVPGWATTLEFRLKA
jgi:signal transduction histidine kinase